MGCMNMNEQQDLIAKSEVRKFISNWKEANENAEKCPPTLGPCNCSYCSWWAGIESIIEGLELLVGEK